MVVRINTSGFLDVLLVLYLLEEPKIDVAILSPEGAQDGWMDGWINGMKRLLDLSNPANPSPPPAGLNGKFLFPISSNINILIINM
jgi:hypothetical protein